MLSVIRSLGLTKEYNNRAVVKDAYFEVREGIIFGFLGPNGAGKTTTIRMLTTVIRPTRGTAQVCSYDICREPLRVRQSIAVVPQRGWLNHYLSVFDNVMVYLMLHGLPFPTAQARTLEGLERFGLIKYSRRRCEELSGGEVRRVQIVRALALDVKCLFLDEPSAGLDPLARHLFWNSLKEVLKERGTTVFLTTHLMHEAEALCDEVALIRDGKVQQLGGVEKLKTTQGIKRVELTLAPGNDGTQLAPITEALTVIPQVTKIEALGNARIVIHWQGDDKDIFKILGTVVNSECVENLSISPPTLEEIYLRLVTQREESANVIST